MPTTDKTSRNQPCPCGSGLKFKNCCLPKQNAAPTRPDPTAAAQQIATHLRTIERMKAAGRLVDALPAMREIARLDPGKAAAHHDAGITCLRCGLYAEAIDHLQHAIHLRPSFTNALVALGAALERESRLQEAAAIFKRASSAIADPVSASAYRAKFLFLDGQTEQAEAELKRTVALAPEHANLHRLLGQVLSQRGDFPAARARFLEAMRLEPHEPHGFYDWANNGRAAEADRDLLTRIAGITERPDLDFGLRVGLHFGLGKSFDELGDVATAMRHYDAGNALQARTTKFDRSALVRHFDSLIRGFTRQAMEHAAASVARPPQPDDDLPLLVLGLPRSGTTLVEQVLSSHPAVAAGGELPFWNDLHTDWLRSGSRSINPSEIARAAADYRATLRRIDRTARRVVDKAPGNFQRIWLLRLCFPHARIVHCRRNPVDTCLSIYFTLFYGRHDYAYDRSDLVFYYRQYERLMAHWRSVLPPDRFIEIDYEDMVTDRVTTTRRLIDFCGLPWDDACLQPERNTRVVRTASAWQARQPVYRTSLERWRRYEPFLGELRTLLPHRADAA